ncbi:MAG: DUF937 domain-containing protein [Ectothiorhodospiraceae bacterium]|nr:DUF937 domain-containing protein [Ectothiorhodospiraceae bacterium]
MNLMQLLMDAAGSQSMAQLGQRAGLDRQATRSVVEQLAPALAGGLRRNVAGAGGLESLASALQRGQHQRYLDEPHRLDEPETVADGNAILGHLLGSKDVSRDLAGAAAARTGVDPGIIKQMLPLLATLAMGALSKQTNGGQALTGGAEGGAGGLLTSLLDADGDGSVVDDVLSMARKFL